MLIQVLLFFFSFFFLNPYRYTPKSSSKKYPCFFIVFFTGHSYPDLNYLYAQLLATTEQIKVLSLQTLEYQETLNRPVEIRVKNEIYRLKCMKYYSLKKNWWKKKNLFTKTLIVPGSHRQSSHPKEKPCYIWVTIQKN